MNLLSIVQRKPHLSSFCLARKGTCDLTSSPTPGPRQRGHRPFREHFWLSLPRGPGRWYIFQRSEALVCCPSGVALGVDVTGGVGTVVYVVLWRRLMCTTYLARTLVRKGNLNPRGCGGRKATQQEGDFGGGSGDEVNVLWTKTGGSRGLGTCWCVSFLGSGRFCGPTCT